MNVEEFLKADPMSLVSAVKAPWDLPSPDIDKTVNTDKLFAISKSSGPNTFGIFDTKQVVRELTVEPEALETSLLNSMDPDALKNLANTSGMSINSDSDLLEALNSTGAMLGGLQQNILKANSPGSVLQQAGPLKANSESMAGQYLPFNTQSIQNFSTDSEVSNFFPNTFPIGGYGDIQKMFNTGGLGSYNNCPGLTGALGYLKKLLDPRQLMGMLGSLFGWVGDYDLNGIINCVASTTHQLDMVQRTSLTDTLVNRGSLNGYTELSRVGNTSNVTDQYQTVYRVLGTNRQVTTSPRTGRPTNTWQNPDIMSKSDELFANTGTNKNRMFSANVRNTTRNPSVMNRLPYDVQDVRSIRQTDPATGFAQYCVGETAGLLRKLPMFA